MSINNNLDEAKQVSVDTGSNVINIDLYRKRQARVIHQEEKKLILVQIIARACDIH